MSILVSGGAGYIGSHTVLALLEQGYDVVVFDNLSNSSEEALRRVEQIAGKKLKFYKADMRDADAMNRIFDENPDITSCIHFAGLKAVAVSVSQPIEYYKNNIGGTLTLVEAMRAHNVKNIIFSSSATVYGSPTELPITENSPKGVCTNPYGWTKWMIEQILTDVHTADPSWNVILLRYFNPVGAHESGLIGEDPQGVPNNLTPYIAQVAVGRRPHLNVNGNDYNTPDGTGVRDYIHVVDLAEGHLKALEKISELKGEVKIYNLGTGKGSSVFDVLHAFERACGRELPYVIAPRRPGDIDACWADPSLAEKELGWKAKFNLDDMCRDSWNWQEKNPYGYSNKPDEEQ